MSKAVRSEYTQSFTSSTSSISKKHQTATSSVPTKHLTDATPVERPTFFTHPIALPDLTPQAIKVSESTATTPQIKTATNLICYYISSQLPHLFVALPGSSSAAPQVGFTEKGLEMYKRIRHFFQFAQERAYLTGGEIVYSVALIEKLVRIELETKARWKQDHDQTASKTAAGETVPTSIISDTSLGTLLLLSVMLANKWLRDVPVRNSWWAKAFGVPLPVVNQSELILMQRLHDSLWVEAEAAFPHLFSFILGLNTESTVPAAALVTPTEESSSLTHSSSGKNLQNPQNKSMRSLLEISAAARVQSTSHLPNPVPVLAP